MLFPNVSQLSNVKLSLERVALTVLTPVVKYESQGLEAKCRQISTLKST